MRPLLAITCFTLCCCSNIRIEDSTDYNKDPKKLVSKKIKINGPLSKLDIQSESLMIHDDHLPSKPDRNDCSLELWF